MAGLAALACPRTPIINGRALLRLGSTQIRVSVSSLLELQQGWDGTFRSCWLLGGAAAQAMESLDRSGRWLAVPDSQDLNEHG